MHVLSRSVLFGAVPKASPCQAVYLNQVLGEWMDRMAGQASEILEFSGTQTYFSILRLYYQKLDPIDGTAKYENTDLVESWASVTPDH